MALTGGLRMFVMTTAFLCLLASTKIQDIAQALVEKFHMPYEYAFMLTTALRFVSRISCQTAPSPLTPVLSGVFQPRQCLETSICLSGCCQTLVMRAVAKSDTLALSMELKGFGPNTYRNRRPMKLGVWDYFMLLVTVLLCAYPLEPSCRSLTSAKQGSFL